MNEPIQVAERHIGDGAIQTVNARELHVFLGVGKVFAAWIKGRIEQYGFVENQDFAIAFPVLEKQSGRGGDRCSKEYHISLDMAKELAMVERNDKGNVIDITTALADPAKLRTVLLGYTEKVVALCAKPVKLAWGGEQ